MLIRSVPLDSGAPLAGRSGGDPAVSTICGLVGPPALSDLVDGVPRAGLQLPCRTGEADLWFAEAPSELERAKALCAQCPVRADCLAGALRRREPWGVWGGEVFVGGVVVPRKRPRGRPRKDAVAA